MTIEDFSLNLYLASICRISETIPVLLTRALWLKFSSLQSDYHKPTMWGSKQERRTDALDPGNFVK